MPTTTPRRPRPDHAARAAAVCAALAAFYRQDRYTLTAAGRAAVARPAR